MNISNPYAERRFLRSLEKGWSKLEALVNRFTTSEFNPFYHLGTLTTFMIIVLIVTGIYLTIFYRPGVDRAYQTVAWISSTWFGSLMRSIHRYASDAMILLTLLHFLKMLFSDRFWGARWLAWTSGWIMLAVAWLVGAMGYWLVWDERAQWTTEYIMQLSRGASALTFTAADLASKTFAAFVIVLFLHVFIPLLVFVGIYIHVLRLSRARWWAPRWIMIQSVLGLILLSILAPVKSAAPADLSRLIQSTPMDAYYLGFLPLIDLWGDAVFWGLAVFVGGSLFLLPWLAKGRHSGPAQVLDTKCAGCTLCAVECPYQAINMVKREDGFEHSRLAVVHPRLCTGCGICVGACPLEAIELQSLPGNLVISSVQEAIKAERKAGHPVTVLFACQRDQALGTLKDLLPVSTSSNSNGAPVSTIPWGAHQSGRVVVAAFPCVGMADTDWVPALLKDGAREVVFLACPHDDCIHREGTAWMLSRFKRHPALIQPGLHFLENTPGESGVLISLLNTLHNDGFQKKAPVLPNPKKRAKGKPSLVASLVGIVVLTALFAAALPLDLRAGYRSADMAGLRLEVDAKGKIAARAAVTAPGIELPPGADATKIFGGKRHPLSLRLVVDGETLFEQAIEPSGLRGEGRLSGQEFLSLPPGEHRVEIFINDDETEFRRVFNETLRFEQARVLLLAYDEANNRFVVR